MDQSLGPSDPIASFGRRALAWLIDAAIGTAVVTAIFVYDAMSHFDVVQFRSRQAAEAHCDVLWSEETKCVVSDNSVWSITGEFDINVSALVIAGLVMVLLQTMLLPGLTGWSPGKLLMELRVVDAITYQRAGLRANIVRGVCWIVDAFPFALVGIHARFHSDERRRVGDIVAGTLVVDKSALGEPPGLAEGDEARIADTAGTAAESTAVS